MIKSADEQKIQGWYGNRYNNKIPEYCAIYETKTRNSNTFMWLLIPAKGVVPDVKYKIIALEKDLGHIRFSFGDKAFEVKMNFTGMSEVSALK